MYFIRAIFLSAICLSASFVFSQTDSTVVVVDSTILNPDAKRNPIFNTPVDTTVKIVGSEEVKPKIFKDSARLALEELPRMAIRRSATIPGWGQIKNGRWWKVPIIYGGFVGLGLGFEFNQRLYRQFLDELQYRYNNEGKKRDPELIEGDEQALIRYKDYYRRNRDLCVLAGVGLYAINIIDAYIDAKFFSYDVSDDLGVRIRPAVILPSHAYALPIPAIKIQFNL